MPYCEMSRDIFTIIICNLQSKCCNSRALNVDYLLLGVEIKAKRVKIPSSSSAIEDGIGEENSFDIIDLDLIEKTATANKPALLVFSDFQQRLDVESHNSSTETSLDGNVFLKIFIFRFIFKTIIKKFIKNSIDDLLTSLLLCQSLRIVILNS